MSLADEFIADLLELEDTSVPVSKEPSLSLNTPILNKQINGPRKPDEPASNVEDICKTLKTQAPSSQLTALLALIQDQDLEQQHHHTTSESTPNGNSNTTMEAIDDASDASMDSSSSEEESMDDTAPVHDANVPRALETPEYLLVVKANTVNMDIEHDLQVIYRFVLDHYRPAFPELSELVKRPLDYVRVAGTLGPHPTPSAITLLYAWMPATIVTSISMALAMSTGTPLPDTIWMHLHRACQTALHLEEARNRILNAIASRMAHIAPNLTALLGSTVAAKLVAAAGGVQALLKIPACNIQVLGHAQRRDLHGFAATDSHAEGSILMQCDLITSVPSELRTKALRMMASRCTLAARIDALGGRLTVGAQYRTEILRKLDKWQEPPAPKAPKALPAPQLTQKARRGGRRLRRLKEKYAMTALREQQNRLAFGVAEQEAYANGGVRGLGMMSATGNSHDLGRIRTAKAQDRTRITKRVALPAAMKQRAQSGGTQTVFGGYSGVASSIVLTQGIQLSNPTAAVGASTATAMQPPANRYFHSNVSFDRIQQKK